MAADAPPGFEAYADESPPVAVGTAGKDGRLELTFAPDGDGQTRLVADYARVPYHLTGTLDRDPHPDGTSVLVQSSTGGLAQGDRIAADVSVRAGGVAHVSTQSATKVQSMDRNYARERVALSVGPDAHLDWVPEPTILHADARFATATTLSVAPGGTAVVGDVVVPGRLARDERFAFERYRSRLRVDGPDGLLLEDATSIRPDEADPTAPGVVGEFAAFGTLSVIAPSDGGDHRDRDPPPDIGPLSDRLHDAVAGGPGVAGVTALPNDAGVAVRALADRAEAVSDRLHAAWSAARNALVDASAPAGRTY